MYGVRYDLRLKTKQTQFHMCLKFVRIPLVQGIIKLINLKFEEKHNNKIINEIRCLAMESSDLIT